MKDPSEALAREILDVVPFAMRLIREEMRRHRGSDLTIPQFRALLYLQRNTGAALHQLADHLGLTPPTVSKMTTALLARGLIDRLDSEIDRRRVELHLTTRGNTLIDRVRGETVAKFSERLEKLPPADREKMMASLGSLRLALKESGDKPAEPHPGSAASKPG